MSISETYRKKARTHRVTAWINFVFALLLFVISIGGFIFLPHDPAAWVNLVLFAIFVGFWLLDLRMARTSDQLAFWWEQYERLLGS